MSDTDAAPGADIDPVGAGSREHYLDAVLYDYEYRRRRADVGFYTRLAQTLMPDGGNILDLACGSGRVTIPLARAGFEVVGIDAAQPMLDQGAARLARQSRAVRSRVEFVRGDIREFSLGRRFPLVTMAFNAFEHLYTRVEVAACLARVREHLEPDGVLVFDVQNPNLRWLTRDPDKRWARTRFTHPGLGRRFVYTTNHEYDPVSQIVLIRLYYQPIDDGGRPDGDERVVTLSQRKFFPAELEALLDANGYQALQRFGDFEGEPLYGDSEAQVVVCRPRPGAAAGGAPGPDGGPGEGEPDADEPEVVAAIGLQRDGHYMYFVKGAALWRMPYGDRDAAEPIVQLDIERDPDYVYFLDGRGHVVRTRRARSRGSS